MMVQQQALTLTYNDVLLLMAGCFFLALPLTLPAGEACRRRARQRRTERYGIACSLASTCGDGKPSTGRPDTLWNWLIAALVCGPDTPSAGGAGSPAGSVGSAPRRSGRCRRPASAAAVR